MIYLFLLYILIFFIACTCSIVVNFCLLISQNPRNYSCHIQNRKKAIGSLMSFGKMVFSRIISSGQNQTGLKRCSEIQTGNLTKKTKSAWCPYIAGIKDTLCIQLGLLLWICSMQVLAVLLKVTCLTTVKFKKSIIFFSVIYI